MELQTNLHTGVYDPDGKNLRRVLETKAEEERNLEEFLKQLIPTPREGRKLHDLLYGLYKQDKKIRGYEIEDTPQLRIPIADSSSGEQYLLGIGFLGQSLEDAQNQTRALWAGGNPLKPRDGIYIGIVKTTNGKYVDYYPARKGSICIWNDGSYKFREESVMKGTFRLLCHGLAVIRDMR